MIPFIGGVVLFKTLLVMTDHPLSSPLNYVIPPQIFHTPPPGTMNKKCERAPSNKYVCHARLCLQFQTTFKLINSSLKT